jgi:hypothetical protein
VLGDRVWAVGTKPSVPVCTMGTCNANTSTDCPETSNNRVSYVSQGAQLVVQSIPAAGGAPITLELPARLETMVDARDSAESHAQVMQPLGTTPLDFVVLPGNQYVAIVATSTYNVESLFRDTIFGPLRVLPCLNGSISEWLLVDMASSSTAQRVRSSCEVSARPDAVFDVWKCASPPEGEASTQGDYIATAVGALFGVR